MRLALFSLILISIFFYGCSSPTEPDDSSHKAQLIAQYKKFADDHYSHEQFLKWYKYVTDSTTLNVIIRVTAHDSAYINYDQPNKTDDYYEMIGKYYIFTQGWNDVSPILDTIFYMYQNSGHFSLLPDTAKYWSAFALNMETPYIYNGGNIVAPCFAYLKENSSPFYYGMSINQLYYRTLMNEAK